MIFLVCLLSFVLTLFTPISTASLPAGSRSNPVLVLVDGFTSYISGHCREYSEERGIQVIDILSKYTCDLFTSQGKVVPENLRAPEDGDEESWANSLGIDILDRDNLIVIAESDSGVPTAERIQSRLRLKGNGESPQLRNKYLSNEFAKKAGLDVVKQKLVSSWKEAKEFIDNLWNEENDRTENLCVIKPYRGDASDGVFLCKNLEEAETAFGKLFNKPKFGGGINEAVLIQEFADGVEYAVDTVAMDGEIKVIALWKYGKFSVNNAPFVYQCTELVSSNKGGIEIEVLQAQPVRWGPTHTEIKYTKNGPRLIEINPRWHAQHFSPITRACLGNDAVTATLDGFFEPDCFQKLPIRPDNLAQSGLILHLVSYQEGIIRGINHVDEIESRPSVQLVDIALGVGDNLVKTVDIRTDAGYFARGSI
eukprot:gene6279-8646_t